jgi:hypothetical protein
MADADVIAWTAVKPGHRVLDREGHEIGAVHRVLADDGADIFHGVSLRRGVLGKEVEITADRIERITAEYIHTDLSVEQVDDLPAARGG